MDSIFQEGSFRSVTITGYRMVRKIPEKSRRINVTRRGVGAVSEEMTSLKGRTSRGRTYMRGSNEGREEVTKREANQNPI